MPESVDIELQPKQFDLLTALTKSKAPVIGVGGGRGAAKSSGADRCVLTLMYQRPGLKACIVMRNWDQCFKFHVQAIKRDFPWLVNNLKQTMPASLRIGKSECDFSYGENLDDLERRFRSGNYDLIIIDQAEQFSERELREVRKAVRSKGGGIARLCLLFNMRGAGIDNLRNWFHLKKVGKNESADDYLFIKANPWDNIEWVRSALIEDSYTEQDYYSWTDEQRCDYSLKRGAYTRQLASGDEALSKADFWGDWDSVEGTYFANVFDLDNTMISPGKAQAMFKPWATAWVSQDYGVSHFNATYWHYRVSLSPSDILTHLGWTVPHPLNVVVTYREMILNGLDANQHRLTADAVARKLASLTPELERKQIRAYYLSPEMVTGDPNCVGSQQAKELKNFGMPYPVKADNERVGGWQLMAKLLRATKFAGIDPNTGPLPDVWLISSECAQLLEAIPKLLRDPKDLDDVMKTDKASAKIEQDVADAVRYGLKSMLAPRKKTAEDEFNIAMNNAGSDTQRAMMALEHFYRTQRKGKHKSGWQQRLDLVSHK